MSNYKKFYIYRDVSGATAVGPCKNLPLGFTQTETASIDEEVTPSLYAVVPDNTPSFMIRLTYIPSGYVSPGHESGCLAWVKIKDTVSSKTFQKTALSPEWVEMRAGNIIYITGARVFDSYFTVQFEYFDIY
ncbi:hypothetical protein HGB13_00320 [bacterium]|nr:hypothetical protein [bacterium]